MTVLSKTFKSGKGAMEATEASANSEHVRLCVGLVPLKGESNLEPQNMILVTFAGFFQNIRRVPHPVTFIWESPPVVGGSVVGACSLRASCCFFRQETLLQLSLEQPRAQINH